MHTVCVEQLLAAGAPCVGKTVTDELAFSLIGENHFYSTPLNPAAPDRVPGKPGCPRKHPEKLHADAGYDCEATRSVLWVARDRLCRLTISQRPRASTNVKPVAIAGRHGLPAPPHSGPLWARRRMPVTERRPGRAGEFWRRK